MVSCRLKSANLGTGPWLRFSGIRAATFTSGLLHTGGISPSRGRRLPKAQAVRSQPVRQNLRSCWHPAPRMLLFVERIAGVCAPLWRDESYRAGKFGGEVKPGDKSLGLMR